jgi:hypothetical protein
MRHLRTLRGWWRFVAEPFEVFLAAAGLASGLPVLIGVTEPSSLARQVAPWMLHAWALGVVLGGVLTLLARWRIARAQTPDAQESAARIEVMGMTLSAGTYTMYGLCILAVGVSGIPAGSIIIGLAAAYVVRARVITVEWEEHRSARRPRRRTAGPHA